MVLWMPRFEATRDLPPSTRVAIELGVDIAFAWNSGNILVVIAAFQVEAFESRARAERKSQDRQSKYSHPWKYAPERSVGCVRKNLIHMKAGALS
jgi:hypothetical protein